MKILFLYLVYEKANSNLYTDLVEEFKDKGHEIYVVTINERKNKEETQLNQENGVNVLRVKTGNLFGVNFIEKGITTLKLGKDFEKEINKHLSDIKFDMVVHHTPPITFTNVIKDIQKKNKECKSYLILRDIFPQNAVDLGVIKNKFLFNFFRGKEAKLYESSDYIGCMSEGNIDYLLKHNPEIEGDKLHILRNWGKLKGKINVDKSLIRSEYGFKTGDFIAVFGGNMGRPQGLENLLELAKEVKSYSDIKFLLVGKGNEKNKLEKIISEQKLTNVIMKDFIPREDYEKLIASCDIGLVSLHKDFTIPNIPSKTIDYFKLNLPILAATDKNTDYGKILEAESRGGLSCLYGDIETYKKNLLTLYKDEEMRRELGANGRRYYENYLGVDKAYKVIIDKVESDAIRECVKEQEEPKASRI